MRKLDIGSVSFEAPGLTFDSEPMGDTRVELLRLLYQGHSLGDAPGGTWRAYNNRSGAGREEVDRTMVKWATAGERVTGKEG